MASRLRRRRPGTLDRKRMGYRTLTGRHISEADLQEVLTDAAATFGWWRAHFRPARTKHGWRTPGQYEAGKGWPDLILVRDRIIVWELKGHDTNGRLGKATPEQLEWLDRWTAAGAEAKVIGPDDIDECIATLARRPQPKPGRQETSNQ